jgi:mannose-6-phosphate isomerase-like protein (cupin superfamily)
MIRKIEKPWGFEEILEENEHYTFKRLTMNSGQACSLQYHEHKLETVYVVRGVLRVYLNEVQNHYVLLDSGDYLTIPPGQVHRMEVPRWYRAPVVYLESSTTYPDDVIRLADSYGREVKSGMDS